jgi:hypothetical protein
MKSRKSGPGKAGKGSFLLYFHVAQVKQGALLHVVLWCLLLQRRRGEPADAVEELDGGPDLPGLVRVIRVCPSVGRV